MEEPTLTMHIQRVLFVLLFFCNYFLMLSLQLDLIKKLPLKSAVGPESLAFDCKGKGPYTGVSDGRILKWESQKRIWKEFAFTSPNWRKEICNRSEDYSMEPTCGRPLGLKFHNKTCNLYIADAYYGLMVVGSKGGMAKTLATIAEGVPFKFTNGLDVNQESGLVYFTDSSTQYQRRDYIWAILNGDSTGRLMEYNPKTRIVKVLLKGLAFANGVALSKNKRFVLVAETSTARILRLWLRGPNAKTLELFSQLRGLPDNIRRNTKGEFWVAVVVDSGLFEKWAINYSSRDGEYYYSLASTLQSTAIKLNEEAKVLKELSNLDDSFQSITEVQENRGTVYLGSLSMPYVGIYVS